MSIWRCTDEGSGNGVSTYTDGDRVADSISYCHSRTLSRHRFPKNVHSGTVESHAWRRILSCMEAETVLKMFARSPPMPIYASTWCVSLHASNENQHTPRLTETRLTFVCNTEMRVTFRRITAVWMYARMSVCIIFYNDIYLYIYKCIRIVKKVCIYGVPII